MCYLDCALSQLHKTFGSILVSTSPCRGFCGSLRWDQQSGVDYVISVVLTWAVGFRLLAPSRGNSDIQEHLAFPRTYRLKPQFVSVKCPLVFETTVSTTQFLSDLTMCYQLDVPAQQQVWRMQRMNIVLSMLLRKQVTVLTCLVSCGYSRFISQLTIGRPIFLPKGGVYFQEGQNCFNPESMFPMGSQVNETDPFWFILCLSRQCAVAGCFLCVMLKQHKQNRLFALKTDHSCSVWLCIGVRLLCIEAETFDPVNSYHVVFWCGIMNFGLSCISWIVISLMGFLLSYASFMMQYFKHLLLFHNDLDCF